MFFNCWEIIEFLDTIGVESFYSDITCWEYFAGWDKIFSDKKLKWIILTL